MPALSDHPRCLRAWRRVAAVAVLFFAATAAEAGPPFVTDDPEQAEIGHWEVNYALMGTHRAGETAASLPVIDANEGAFPGVQLHVQPQMAYARTPAGGPIRAGWPTWRQPTRSLPIWGCR